MKKLTALLILLLLVLPLSLVVAQDATTTPSPVEATPGQSLDMVLMPKFLGILVFDQAYQGAQEAHAELQNPGELTFVGPGPGEGAEAQIPFITNAITQGVNVIMFDNNGGDVTLPAAKEALDAGIPVVTWDSPLSPDGEVLFVAQVDFDQTGQVMADMALSLLGPDGGEFAILSATPDAANQNAWIDAMKKALASDEKYANLDLVDLVYGNDASEDSYNEALGLIDKHPDLKLIMAPTTVGIAAAAKAIQDEGLCGKVLVSGLGLPAEMQGFVQAGCAQDFALWSFVDLGYLTYYVSYLVGTGAIKGDVGESFVAGRMGEYTIEEDPTREGGKRVLMGPFSIFTPENIDQWAVPTPTPES